MITLRKEVLQDLRGEHGALPMRLRCQDGGDAFSAIDAVGASDVVDGTIAFSAKSTDTEVTSFGKATDRVRVIASWQGACCVSAEGGHRSGPWTLKGYVRQGNVWNEMPVTSVPVREELFSPTAGLIETSILADKTVLVAGLGSGGAPIVLELAKLGLNQILADYDRIEVHNVVRHVAGLADVGRRKTRVMVQLVREKNPYAQVESHDVKIGWATKDLVRELVRKSHLTICAVDNHEARVVLNKICCEEHKPLLIAGAFRRAHGGQVLVVIPGKTPCFQCFLRAMPSKASDREVSSAQQAQRYAYSDRPVAIEPGLSTDIAPISQMVAKLAIQLLVQDRPTTLRSLDEDLTASWYLWLNRREKDTDYEHLEPLGCNVDGFHILRWYGVDFGRDAACPCCGDFVHAVADQEGVDVPREGAAKFASGGV